VNRAGNTRFLIIGRNFHAACRKQAELLTEYFLDLRALGGGFAAREGATVLIDRSDGPWPTAALFMRAAWSSVALGGGIVLCRGFAPGVALRLRVRLSEPARRAGARVFADLWLNVRPKFDRRVLAKRVAGGVQGMVLLPGGVEAEVLFVSEALLPALPAAMYLQVTGDELAEHAVQDYARFRRQPHGRSPLP
jgi:hypothetical protein